MASLIGTYNRTNGIKQIPSRVVFSLNGAGLGGDETHPDTITIVRDTRAFPDGEAPPDWRTYDGSDWPAFGEYWYAIHEAYWQLNPADYYQITNEQGGGEGPDVAGNYEQLVKVERAIMQAANAGGRKCAVLNLAGGSPGDFELWKAICAPFIIEAWESGGNCYGRHLYSDKFVNDDGSIVLGQPARVIAELEYLRSIGYGGGVVLTEFGFFGGYGVAPYDYWQQQIKAYEAALLPYADILIGLCHWELGNSEFNADYTDHLKQLLPYIKAGDLPRWMPPEEPEEPPMTTIQIGNNHGGYLTHLGTGEKVVTLIPGYFEGRTFIPTGDPVELVLGDEQRAMHYVSRGVKTVDCPDEPSGPNPPPVELTLPRGSKGVDVSYWQGPFNWNDSGAEFGIIRCSDGMTANTTTHDGNGIDRQFWANAGKLTAVGIPWGIYHFLRPGSIQAQADKVLGAIEKLYTDGTPPVTAILDNGVKFPAVWIDIEDSELTSAHVQEFYNLLAAKNHTGIYTGKPVWDGIMAGTPQWWSAIPLWIAAYGINDGNVPNWPDGPFLPLGWNAAVLWQYSSNPIDQNIVGPYPATAVQPDPPTPPPVVDLIDVAPYFVPSGQYGYKVVMEVGEGTQPMQLEKRANDVILRKGDGNWIDGKRYQDSETWRVKDGQIQKGIDTSDAGNDGKDGYDLGWAQWIPQFVQVGQTYHSAPTVRRFDRTKNCETTGENVANDYLHIKALVPAWVSPANPNIVLNDVLIIEWRSGTADLNVAPNEIYYFAKNISYVGWGSHFIVEIAEGQAPLTGALDCGM